jgi:ribosome-interacting GTPase 1
VLVREDATVDQFIDVILGNRKYIKCIYCYNKIDQISLEEVDKLAREDNTVVVSCESDINIDYLIHQLWHYLDLIRVYTKKRGQAPDFADGLILKRGVTVEEVCRGIHRSLVDDFKFALVWGTSAKHTPQRVGLNHVIQDEDVVQIVKKI